MFFAPLAEVHQGIEPNPQDGFVIITADSDLVLSPEHAREWVDPRTTPARAAEIVKDCCRPTEQLTWFKVSKDVGNVRRQGPQLLAPKL
jgi:putative SOS response-associated peptidase YedK